mgnify:CR=1 FL=1
MSADLNTVLNDLSAWVTLRDGGSLEYVLGLPELIGQENIDLLTACIADNIMEGYTRDFIDYAGAVRDFKKTKRGADAE